MNHRSTLLASAALVFAGSPALAQEAPTTPQQQPATAPTAQQDTQAAQAVDEDYGDEEHGKIGLSFIEWSGMAPQKVVIDWTVDRRPDAGARHSATSR